MGVSRADLRKAENNVAVLNRELDIGEAASSEPPESSESEESSGMSSGLNNPGRRSTRRDTNLNRPQLPDKSQPPTKRRNLMESPLDLLLPEPVRQAPPPRPLAALMGNSDSPQMMNVRMRTFADEVIEYTGCLEMRIKTLEDRVKAMAEELEGLKDTNYHLGENELGYHLRQKPSESSDSNDLSEPVRDRSSSERSHHSFGRGERYGTGRMFGRGQQIKK